MIKSDSDAQDRTSGLERNGNLSSEFCWRDVLSVENNVFFCRIKFSRNLKKIYDIKKTKTGFNISLN